MLMHSAGSLRFLVLSEPVLPRLHHSYIVPLSHLWRHVGWSKKTWLTQRVLRLSDMQICVQCRMSLRCVRYCSGCVAFAVMHCLVLRLSAGGWFNAVVLAVAPC